MFGIHLGGLFTGPVSAFESVKDEDLKRAAITMAVSIAYSQYITFLFMLGLALEKRKLLRWLAPIPKTMAASVFQMQQLQDNEKLFYFGVPRSLVDDSQLLDSIYYEKIKQP